MLGSGDFREGAFLPCDWLCPSTSVPIALRIFRGGRLGGRPASNGKATSWKGVQPRDFVLHCVSLVRTSDTRSGAKPWQCPAAEFSTNTDAAWGDGAP